MWCSAGVFSTTTSVAAAGQTELGDARTPSCEQPRLEVRVDPGAGDDLRALQRADVLLVLADPLVDGLGREQPLLDQERLQRLGPQRHVGLLLRVVGHRLHPS